MRYYLHTIDGKPAGFTGNQICFASKGNGWKAPLVKDLKTIRKEQRLSLKWRIAQGFKDLGGYNYVIVSDDESKEVGIEE